jgi:hypothetical protein
VERPLIRLRGFEPMVAGKLFPLDAAQAFFAA